MEIVECTRCGKPCKVGPPPNPKARLMAFATKAEALQSGLCGNCAAAVFIKSNRILMAGIEMSGIGMLADARVQKQFGDVMQAGFADAKPAELNWQKIIDDWELPIPKKPRRKTL